MILVQTELARYIKDILIVLYKYLLQQTAMTCVLVHRSVYL